MDTSPAGDMRRWAPALALALLVAGCAGAIRPADLDAGVGRWTKVEVLGRLGPPLERLARDGEEIWVYTEAYPIGFGSPYQLDPLAPTIAGGGGVPVGQEAREPAPGAAFQLRRRFLLFFDADAILRRWEQAR